MSYRCHYIFINVLQSAQPKVFVSLSNIFEAQFSHARYCILSIPRTEQLSACYRPTVVDLVVVYLRQPRA